MSGGGALLLLLLGRRCGACALGTGHVRPLLLCSLLALSPFLLPPPEPVAGTPLIDGLLPPPPPRSESWNTFRYVTQQTNWSWGVREAARVSGAVLMWQVGKRMPAKYGITGDLREALYRCVFKCVCARVCMRARALLCATGTSRVRSPGCAAALASGLLPRC